MSYTNQIDVVVAMYNDFSYNKAIQVKMSGHIIFILKLYSNNIETINYKSKNPQVYLMGSNPFPPCLSID